MSTEPTNGPNEDQLADKLGPDGPADTAQGMEVEAQRDQAEEDEAARQEIEQGGG